MTQLISNHQFILINTQKGVNITTFENYRSILEWALLKHIDEYGLGKTQDVMRSVLETELRSKENEIYGRGRDMFGDWSGEDDDRDEESEGFGFWQDGMEDPKKPPSGQDKPGGIGVGG